MIKKTNILLILFFIFTYILLSFKSDNHIRFKVFENHIEHLMPHNSYDYIYLPRLDTIFISSDNYIEISLKTQTAKLVRKDDTSLVFPISSGNDKIDKGIKTATGIFSVQSKLRVGISRQFENAELINWIGFNGNIGFHGLKTNGYYNHLGKRPSSHGCVRISRNDGDTLYKYVKIGTPVIVYEEAPARILSFINDSANHENHRIIGDNNQLKKYLNSRLDNLYNGNGNIDFGNNLLIQNKTIFRKLKINVGEASKISPRQKYIGKYNRFYYSIRDNTDRLLKK